MDGWMDEWMINIQMTHGERIKNTRTILKEKKMNKMQTGDE